MASRSDLLQEIVSTSSLNQRLLHKRLHQTKGHSDLPRAQIQVLMCMYDVQSLSFKALASKLRLTPGAITQLTDPLIKAGYVSRIQDEHDRRMAYVSLSEAGKEKVDSLKKAYRAVFAEAASTLDTTELKSLLGIQKKMLEYLESHTETAPSKIASPDK